MGERKRERGRGGGERKEWTEKVKKKKRTAKERDFTRYKQWQTEKVTMRKVDRRTDRQIDKRKKNSQTYRQVER